MCLNVIDCNSSAFQLFILIKLLHTKFISCCPLYVPPVNQPVIARVDLVEYFDNPTNLFWKKCSSYPTLKMLVVKWCMKQSSLQKSPAQQIPA